MAVAGTRVTEDEYRRIALEDPDGKWELDCGVLRSKPAMTMQHNRLAWFAGHWIQNQLDPDQFEVRVDAGRIQRSPRHYYIPDMMVIPVALMEQFQGDYEALEAYTVSLPLVLEVWSRSTGQFDYETKLPFYQQRGDAEIWFLHPIERTLTAWQKRPDGSYMESTHSGGVVRPVALPGVALDLDALFARLGPVKS
jgi:Uma2 family endonuclease